MLPSLIAMVDDDVSICRSAVRLMRSFGYQAVAFQSAEDFLGSEQRQNLSCLLLDLHLPGMSGLQLQSRLAAEGCSVPIIFLSAFNEEEPRRQAMQAGALAFLSKPYSDEVLLKNIRSALLRG